MNQLPSSLLASLTLFPGFEPEKFIAAHAESEKLTSLRMNPFKPIDSYNNYEKVKWNPSGYYLPERPSFITDPLFHAGCYYVQEASSMFLEQVLKSHLDLSKPLKVLDLCAAPGGKSTLLTSLISDDSLLVANEVIKTRVHVLAENLSKWGRANVIATNSDPKHFASLPGYFDVIVVDAPCSGSGLFRKQPEAIGEWSEEAVNKCSQRQERILADVLPALKENGLLIYSTCSYSSEENEAICDWLCEHEALTSQSCPVPEDWGIEETLSIQHKAKGYRFYPHKVKGEGFFMACFTKKASAEYRLKPSKNTVTRLSKQESALIPAWLKLDKPYELFKQGENIYLMHSAHIDELQRLSGHLYIKKSGVEVGQIKGKDFIPHHQLALSTYLSAEVPSISLDKTQALQFLKKEDLKITAPENGFHLVKFQGYGLGWVKILPNRVNNYLPKEWRILKNIEEYLV